MIRKVIADIFKRKEVNRTVMQYFRLVELLGLGENRFFRILLGATFDVRDIICYGVGCLILGIWEWIRYKNTREAK